MDERYFLVVEYLPRSVVAALAVVRQMPEYQNLALLLLTEHPEKYQRIAASSGEVPVHIVACDFTNPSNIKSALMPYKGSIAGVTCRGDKYVQHLRRLLPYLPPEVPVSTESSLAAATNKRLMRAAFYKYRPEITPGFVEINDASAASISKVEQTMGYPVIVKPADLVSSLLIQSCRNRQELSRALHKTFRTINSLYLQEDRRKQPEVIVEEYLEGDFYSIDAYVTTPGQYFFCPPVAYIPAKQLGIDDFFLYKRFLPAKLKPQETADANRIAGEAMTAINLQYSTVHIELVMTGRGWRIIELGPRVGRFRSTMYRLGYGIDHSLNDVKVRLGIGPDIPTKLLQYCSAYSIYPRTEGKLRRLHGVKVLQELSELHNLKIYAHPGDTCRFAKSGGHALAEFVISAPSTRGYKQATVFVEKNVYADID